MESTNPDYSAVRDITFGVFACILGVATLVIAFLQLVYKRRPTSSSQQEEIEME
jgi:hypothetical protein